MFDFHIEASVEPSSIGLGRFACISPIRAPIRTRIRFGGGRGYYANEYSPVAARNAPAERGNKFIHPPGKVNHPPRLPPDFYAADIHRARARVSDFQGADRHSPCTGARTPAG